MGDEWTGHPWSVCPEQHVDYGAYVQCENCRTPCGPDLGCLCCNEPAHEWLLAEARHVAETHCGVLENLAFYGGMTELGPDPLPWEVR